MPTHITRRFIFFVNLCLNKFFVDPVEFRNQNYRSKRTDNSTKFAFAVMSEFTKDRGKQDVDLVSLSTEELNIILQDFVIHTMTNAISKNLPSSSTKWHPITTYIHEAAPWNNYLS
jgi:hypothetical protein